MVNNILTNQIVQYTNSLWYSLSCLQQDKWLCMFTDGYLVAPHANVMCFYHCWLDNTARFLIILLVLCVSTIADWRSRCTWIRVSSQGSVQQKVDSQAERTISHVSFPLPSVDCNLRSSEVSVPDRSLREVLQTVRCFNVSIVQCKASKMNGLSPVKNTENSN